MKYLLILLMLTLVGCKPQNKKTYSNVGVVQKDLGILYVDNNYRWENLVTPVHIMLKELESDTTKVVILKYTNIYRSGHSPLFKKVIYNRDDSTLVWENKGGLGRFYTNVSIDILMKISMDIQNRIFWSVDGMNGKMIRSKR